MSGTDDLRNLLDRLKDEVGPLPPEEEEAAPRPLPRAERQPPAAGQPQRFQRGYRQEPPREFQRDAGVNVVWSENKEAMLFGVLASVIMALGGVLAGLEYLVLVGAVFFILFGLVMFLALFGYYLNFRSRVRSDQGLSERVDALSRKLETLAARPQPVGQTLGGMGSEKERELEHKVEELRVLVKSLSRAMDQNNR